MGLFQPAWNSNNFDKAVKAVNKETDQNKLLEIFKAAPNGLVRAAAIGKVNVQTVMATDDHHLLMDIAKDVSASDAVRKEARKKLTDQKFLAEMAINSDIIARDIAVEKLTDQTALAYIIGNEKYDTIRLKAAEKFADQSSVQAVYAQIAKTAEYGSTSVNTVCERAVQRLTDSKLLADVAINSEDSRIGRKAVEKLDDQLLLVQVAKNAKPSPVLSLSVIMAAVKRIADMKTLNNLVNDKNLQCQLRQAAFLEKTNRMLKQEINIEDEKNLVHISIENVRNVTSQATLAYIAINCDSNHIAMNAVEHIADAQMLYYITMCDHWDLSPLRKYIKTLTNSKQLTNIAEYAALGRYQNLATERLTELPDESI